MSYSEKRAFTFRPEWSGGAEDDVVVVPNLPLIVSVNREQKVVGEFENTGHEEVRR